eukprot:3842942-Rhodomonas_salina.4
MTLDGLLGMQLHSMADSGTHSRETACLHCEIKADAFRTSETHCVEKRWLLSDPDSFKLPGPQILKLHHHHARQCDSAPKQRSNLISNPISSQRSSSQPPWPPPPGPVIPSSVSNILSFPTDVPASWTTSDCFSKADARSGTRDGGWISERGGWLAEEGESKKLRVVGKRRWRMAVGSSRGGGGGRRRGSGWERREDGCVQRESEAGRAVPAALGGGGPVCAPGYS